MTEVEEKVQHTPEPWALRDESQKGHGFSIYSPQSPYWSSEVAHYIGEKDAKRIIACVNACAGIPTEALENGALGDALKTLALYADPHNWNSHTETDYSGSYTQYKNAIFAIGRDGRTLAQEAIAKVEGRA